MRRTGDDFGVDLVRVGLDWLRSSCRLRKPSIRVWRLPFRLPAPSSPRTRVRSTQKKPSPRPILQCSFSPRAETPALRLCPLRPPLAISCDPAGFHPLTSHLDVPDGVSDLGSSCPSQADLQRSPVTAGIYAPCQVTSPSLHRHARRVFKSQQASACALNPRRRHPAITHPHALGYSMEVPASPDPSVTPLTPTGKFPVRGGFQLSGSDQKKPRGDNCNRHAAWARSAARRQRPICLGLRPACLPELDTPVLVQYNCNAADSVGNRTALTPS